MKNSLIKMILYIAITLNVHSQSNITVPPFGELKLKPTTFRQMWVVPIDCSDKCMKNTTENCEINLVFSSNLRALNITQSDLFNEHLMDSVADRSTVLPTALQFFTSPFLLSSQAQCFAGSSIRTPVQPLLREKNCLWSALWKGKDGILTL